MSGNIRRAAFRQDLEAIHEVAGTQRRRMRPFTYERAKIPAEAAGRRRRETPDAKFMAGGTTCWT